ncbi:MAG: DUF4157 domain-containing protein [Lewinellaceae bacterium]|nr:DUF4157 domain-containing protein [Lewinellaceae bacterium]
MKTSEAKTAAQNLHRQQANQPFFRKEEESPAVFGPEPEVQPFFSPPGDGQGVSPFFSPSIQPKLKIGQPGDQYEQEADAMAEKVVQRLEQSNERSSKPVASGETSTNSLHRSTLQELHRQQQEGEEEEAVHRKPIFESEAEPVPESVQRQALPASEIVTAPNIQHQGQQESQDEEEISEEEPELQRKPIFESDGDGENSTLQAKETDQILNLESSGPGSNLESRLAATKGSGAPMGEGTRTSMESAFGSDFSGVRVHTDPSSVQMSQELGARAFTHGSDVYFNAGQYDPGSGEGKKLLAHELTHVVQQGGKLKNEKIADSIRNSGRFIQRQGTPETGLGTTEGEVTTLTESETEDATSVFSKGEYTVSKDPADSNKLIVKKGEDVLSSGSIKISERRDELVGDEKAEYTLNAVVKIARFVGEQVDGITYSIPTDLMGTSDDNNKIVPDDIIMGIALLQAYHEIGIDGEPGPQFIAEVMGLFTEEDSATRKKKFMDESSNTSLTGVAGNQIEVPDFDSEEATLYDFFRSITLARNGLWSDRDNITNITGIRRQLEDPKPHWNDTIAVSWVTIEEETQVKHSKIFVGTTEPGNLSTNKKLLPQTIIFKLGYHKSRQPAGRGHRTLTQTASGELIFDPKDQRGLNLHPGGTTGKILGMSSQLPGGTVSTEEQVKANLILVEIFSILTRWGIDPSKAAYKNLEEWKGAQSLVFGGIEGGNISVYKEGEADNPKLLTINPRKNWLVQHWVVQKSDRETFFRILEAVDEDFERPENSQDLTTAQLLALVTDQHVEGIVKKQLEVFPQLNKIDGYAGSTFLDILDGKIPGIAVRKAKAEADFERIEELFAKFNTNTVLTEAHKTYLKENIKAQTLAEREILQNPDKTEELEDKALEVKEEVGPWSTLCQVIFGPEKFYEFLMDVTDKALESGQRRWYYTLINDSSLTPESTSSSESTTGPVEES